MYNVKKVLKGETLIKEGGLELYIYLLKAGQMIVSKKTPGGGVRHLGYINPGEFIGEMAYLSEKFVHSSDVVAALDSEVIEIESDQFYDALAKNPVWLKALLKSLVQRIESLNKKI